jgi:3-oxoacyl-(acyl-carrier-protein) synthase
MFSNGSACAILESSALAATRRAEVLGRVVARGSGTDPTGYYSGEARPTSTVAAIRRGLERFGTGIESIGWIKAHGTGTRANDTAEMEAMEALFHGTKVPMTSLKGAIGHSGGAAGLVESVAALLALRRGVIPPTFGTSQPIPSEVVRVVTETETTESTQVLSLSYGLGGHLSFCVLGI